MAQTSADALLVPLDALDRADMPRGVKKSLRKSIVAIAAAYAEDDDPQKVAPTAQSFIHLLDFLAHPHRWSWPAPAIAVSPEGDFSAVWDDPGAHRWIIDFHSDGTIQETYIETYPDGRVEYRSDAISSIDEINPPFSI